MELNNPDDIGARWHGPQWAAALMLGATLIASGCVGPAPAGPGQRIVSLAPSITETLFAVGAGAEVVGVSQYCDYPPQVLSLPKVGSFLTPNLEAIAGLRPGLIIGLDTSANDRQIRALQRIGYRVLLVNDDSLSGIEDGIGRIGAMTGHGAAAQQLLNSMHTRMRAVRESLKGVAPRKVLMVVGHDPLVAVGGGYLNRLMQMADCINIAEGFGAQWPRLSLEYILAAAPEVILDGQMGSDPLTPSGFWSRYPTIPAVRNHRVFGYDQNPVLRPGPRVAQTLAILASLTHPEVFVPAGGRRALTAPSPAAWDGARL
jgi:iron complex transport system substrate-binding protein